MDNMEALAALIANELKAGKTAKADAPAKEPSRYTEADYPMLQKHRADIKTPTGKSMGDITLENVLAGKVSIQDVRISGEMLHAQAQIAESAGKKQLGQNLRRAAELTQVPDDAIIQMYDLLRPHRATKAQLGELAETLLQKYRAPLCAQLVREAAEIYEKRNILRA